MRSKFTAPGLSIYYYTVEFDAATLPWADFRGKVLGPTDPASAPPESTRGMVMAQWKDLGLAAEPDTGDNGVHASASPFEGLAERLNWIKADFKKDAFAQALVKAGVSEKTIKAWCVDPQVVTEKKESEVVKGSIFDALEDMDADACLKKCGELGKLNKE